MPSPRCLSLIALAAAPAPLRAAEAEPSLAGSAAQMVLGLAVVIGLLLASLWLIKRLSAPRGAAAGLKVLGAAPVGPRERVVLVEVAGKVLVLGVTSGNISPLHTLSADELDDFDPGAPAHATPGGFGGRLKRAMEQRREPR